MKIKDGLNLLRRDLSDPKYDEPTSEEEEMLMRRVADGDSTARLERYERTLRYVLKIAGKRGKKHPGSIGDLFSEGAKDCYIASQEWDPMRDGPFLPYAKEYILKPMRSWLKQNSKYKKLSYNLKRGERERKKGKESTRTVVILGGIEPDVVEDQSSNPEEVTDTLEQYYDMVIPIVPLYFILLRDFVWRIKNPYLQKFLSELIVHSTVSSRGWGWFFLRYAFISVKTYNYAKRHLFWYIPFLEKKFGEEVKQWPESKILKKFNNTLNHIWRQYIEGNIYDYHEVIYIIKCLLGHISYGMAWLRQGRLPLRNLVKVRLKG